MAVTSASLERVDGRAAGASLARWWAGVQFPSITYAASQLLVLLVAVVQALALHSSLATEFTRWDGQWYLRLAAHGYPGVAPDAQSTLGFLPLYPALMWLVDHVTALGLATSGLLIARLGGLVATVLVHRMATGWWGREAGRRATLVFAFFPGVIVFSLLYADGLLLALVGGCLLALERRRWWLAGLLAALAGATGADGAAIAVACLTGAAIHIWRTRAWADRAELRCLAAPALAPAGLAAFGIYLWIRVGSPLASLHAQRTFWGNRTDPLSLIHHYEVWLQMGGRGLNLLVGLLGVPFIVGTGYLLIRMKERPPGPVIAWGMTVTALSVMSAGLTPNPRMLLFGFPSMIVLARYVQGRAFALMIGASAAALAVVSWWTLTGHILP